MRNAVIPNGELAGGEFFDEFAANSRGNL